jgi:phosphoglycolate phosphatase
LDGTLLDSKRRVYTLFCELAGSDQLSFVKFWEIKRAGASQKELLTGYFGFSDLQASAFRARWMEQIEEDARLLTDEPHPRALPLLQSLSRDNRLCVVTGRQYAKKAHAQIERFGWDKYLVGTLATGQTRPKADVIRDAVDVAAEDVFVGDGPEDILAGKELGMRTIAVGSGFFSTARLGGYQPGVIVDDLGDIENLL